MPSPSPESQLAGFIAKYSPVIAKQTRAVLAALRTRLPGATELVYDNYNALAIGFGPTDRVGDIIFSVAAYPRWVSLFFMQARGLPDPTGLLQGSGTKARHIVLGDPADLDRPAVRALIRAALATAIRPLDRDQPRRLVIKSISAKQRPRRPPATSGPKR